MRKLPPRPTVHIGAAVPPAMHAALVAEAKRLGVSTSDVLRWALVAYFPALQNGSATPTEQAS